MHFVAFEIWTDESQLWCLYLSLTSCWSDYLFPMFYSKYLGYYTFFTDAKVVFYCPVLWTAVQLNTLQNGYLNATIIQIILISGLHQVKKYQLSVAKIILKSKPNLRTAIPLPHLRY